MVDLLGVLGGSSCILNCKVLAVLDRMWNPGVLYYKMCAIVRGGVGWRGV